MTARDRTAAERAARRRKRKGSLVVPPVAVGPAAIEALIDMGHLKAWDAKDKRAVHAALEEYLRGAEVLTIVTA